MSNQQRVPTGLQPSTRGVAVRCECGAQVHANPGSSTVRGQHVEVLCVCGRTVRIPVAFSG